tara:strand:- start:154 stop:579 length:426 start_codon:yes stop_codon:yes gene_type:complete
VGSYILAQNARFIGVMKIARTLDMAVRLTDKAMFPLASAEKKLEILPPGHAATIIIPKAKLGLGSNIQMIMNVNIGRTTNWDNTPTKVPRGLANTILKSLGVSFKETPNMMMPRLIFRIKMFWSEKLRVMLSIDSISNLAR